MKNLNKQTIHLLYKEKDFLKLNLNSINVRVPPTNVKFYSPREHNVSPTNIFTKQALL